MGTWSSGTKYPPYPTLPYTTLHPYTYRVLSHYVRKLTHAHSLNQQGYPLGLRLLDLLLSRTPNPLTSIRPTRILPLLQFIAQTVYKHLFNRPADALERSGADAAQYMIFDNEPLVNQYISLPKELSSLNCAAFVAGVIEGVCDGAGFPTEGVTAHSVGEEEGGRGMWPGKTVFLIKFKPEVLEREEILGRGGG